MVLCYLCGVVRRRDEMHLYPSTAPGTLLLHPGDAFKMIKELIFSSLVDEREINYFKYNVQWPVPPEISRERSSLDKLEGY